MVKIDGFIRIGNTEWKYSPLPSKILYFLNFVSSITVNRFHLTAGQRLFLDFDRCQVLASLLKGQSNKIFYL